MAIDQLAEAQGISCFAETRTDTAAEPFILCKHDYKHEPTAVYFISPPKSCPPSGLQIVATEAPVARMRQLFRSPTQGDGSAEVIAFLIPAESQKERWDNVS
jgi:hypothetical protein